MVQCSSLLDKCISFLRQGHYRAIIHYFKEIEGLSGWGGGENVAALLLTWKRYVNVPTVYLCVCLLQSTSTQFTLLPLLQQQLETMLSVVAATVRSRSSKKSAGMPMQPSQTIQKESQHNQHAFGGGRDFPSRLFFSPTAACMKAPELMVSRTNLCRQIIV